MGLRSTDDRKETCQNCRFAKPVGYRQIVCTKTNQWYPELHSCDYFDLKSEYVENTDGTK